MHTFMHAHSSHSSTLAHAHITHSCIDSQIHAHNHAYSYIHACSHTHAYSHVLAHAHKLMHVCTLTHSLTRTFSHTRRHFPFLSVPLPTFLDEFQNWAGIIYPRHWLHQSWVFKVKLRLEPYRLDANSSLDLRSVLAALARCLEEAPRL